MFEVFCRPPRYFFIFYLFKKNFFNADKKSRFFLIVLFWAQKGVLRGPHFPRGGITERGGGEKTVCKPFWDLSGGDDGPKPSFEFLDFFSSFFRDFFSIWATPVSAIFALLGIFVNLKKAKIFQLFWLLNWEGFGPRSNFRGAVCCPKLIAGFSVLAIFCPRDFFLPGLFNKIGTGFLP